MVAFVGLVVFPLEAVVPVEAVAPLSICWMKTSTWLPWAPSVARRHTGMPGSVSGTVHSCEACPHMICTCLWNWVTLSMRVNVPMESSTLRSSLRGEIFTNTLSEWDSTIELFLLSCRSGHAPDPSTCNADDTAQSAKACVHRVRLSTMRNS